MFDGKTIGLALVFFGLSLMGVPFIPLLIIAIIIKYIGPTIDGLRNSNRRDDGFFR